MPPLHHVRLAIAVTSVLLSLLVHGVAAGSRVESAHLQVRTQIAATLSTHGLSAILDPELRMKVGSLPDWQRDWGERAVHDAVTAGQTRGASARGLKDEAETALAYRYDSFFFLPPCDAATHCQVHREHTRSLQLLKRASHYCVARPAFSAAPLPRRTPLESRFCRLPDSASQGLLREWTEEGGAGAMLFAQPENGSGGPSASPMFIDADLFCTLRVHAPTKQTCQLLDQGGLTIPPAARQIARQSIRSIRNSVRSLSDYPAAGGVSVKDLAPNGPNLYAWVLDTAVLPYYCQELRNVEKDLQNTEIKGYLNVIDREGIRAEARKYAKFSGAQSVRQFRWLCANGAEALPADQKDFLYQQHVRAHTHVHTAVRMLPRTVGERKVQTNAYYSSRFVKSDVATQMTRREEMESELSETFGGDAFHLSSKWKVDAKGNQLTMGDRLLQRVKGRSIEEVEPEEEDDDSEVEEDDDALVK